MSSRSYFLLLKDLRDLEENQYTGITAFPVSEDKLKWEASIEGLRDTIWDGIYFPLTINFTSEYNLVPPVVKFKIIPFHPNVDQHTGRPCIDFLDDPRKWKTSYTLSSILLTLQVMLSNPVLENPVNLQAAQTLVENETLYKLIVQKLFHEKLSLDKDSSSDLSKDSNKLIRAIRVSFDDYHKTWSDLATSKAAESFRTPLLENPGFIGQYHKWKKMEQKHQKEWNLKYAAAKAQYTRETKTPYKVQYQSSRIYPSPVSDSPSETEVVLKIHEAEEWEDDGEHIHEPGEEEVEELVNWAHTLNSDTLDV